MLLNKEEDRTILHSLRTELL